jgi:Putative Flp pilus-assembly TadE/G-like
MPSSAATDRGMVLVWAAVSLVVLLGMGALVIDVGALYQEQREVRNGADAAALAVAKDCALDDCLDEYRTADHYADENAKDEASNVPLVCGEGPGLTPCSDPPPKTERASGWVRVDTSTHNPGNDANDTQIDLVLAPVLDAANVGETVTASAVAAWAPLGSATTIPLTVSACEFAAFGGSLDPPSFPTERDYIYLHNTMEAGTCPDGPPGADPTGGFGWLDASDCVSQITANRWVDDKPGSSVPPGCDPHDWRNAELVIPLFDRTRGLSGTDGEYHVAGFAGFTLLGYRFDSANGWNIPMCPDGGGLAACIYGEFTRIIATDGEFGGGDDFGARTVKMIG